MKSQDTKSTYKNLLHFYIPATSSLKNEIKKIISFIITSKIITYLRINLTKEVKNLYTDTINTEERN